jgi:hypothetical protein
MSIPVGTFIDELAIQCNNPAGTADETFKEQVWAKLNEAYRDVCGAFNWSVLKNNVTISDTTFLVPADCRNIIQVIDDDKQPYNMLPGKNRQSNFNYNWYFDNAISTPLAEGTTLAVSEYGTALTATAEFPAATCVGEYIRISSNIGLYKISAWTSASSMTLVDHFRGDAVSNGIFQVRPRGTQVLAFCDSAGDAITPTGVEVTYVRYPLGLYRDEDVIELPGYCTAVKVRALQKLLSMLGFNQAADRKQSEYISALTEMRASEPQQPLVQPTSMFQDRRYARGKGYIRSLSDLNGRNW